MGFVTEDFAGEPDDEEEEDKDSGNVEEFGLHVRWSR